MNLKSPLIIGLMSGTSLDGVDLAACQFTEEPNGWSYKVVAAKTITYSLAWESRLKNVMQLSA